MKTSDNLDKKLLSRALLSLETEEECEAFLEDLLTTKEYLDIIQRLNVAKMLSQKLVFNKISANTGASTTTITRVNHCLNYGSGGYKMVLDRTKEEK